MSKSVSHAVSTLDLYHPSGRCFFNSISFFFNLSMCTPWRDSVYAATPLVVLNNFWKYLFVKIVARVLGPDHIVTRMDKSSERI
jgi:hypothetical protein